ncbi:hypothetical protein FQZ97_1004730 [compost metagenome]
MLNVSFSGFATGVAAAFFAAGAAFFAGAASFFAAVFVAAVFFVAMVLLSQNTGTIAGICAA